MPAPIMAEDIRRVHELLSRLEENQHAMAILDELSRGHGPKELHHTGDPQATSDAIHLLEQMGFVEIGHEPGEPADKQPVTLTAQGVSLVRALSDGPIDEVKQ